MHVITLRKETVAVLAKVFFNKKKIYYVMSFDVGSVVPKETFYLRKKRRI